MDNPSSSTRAGRPATLSRQQIVQAALASSSNRLTVRGLAKRLGVSHSALYRWVRSRDELLALINDALLGGVTEEMSNSSTEDWREWFIELAQALRRELLPVITSTTVAQLPLDTEHYRLLRDQAVSGMTRQGVPSDVAHESFDVYLLTVWGWLIAEGSCIDTIAYDAHFNHMCRALARGLAINQ